MVALSGSKLSSQGKNQLLYKINEWMKSDTNRDQNAMLSQAGKTQTPSLQLIRMVHNETLTIRLWIEAGRPCGINNPEQIADDVASSVYALDVSEDEEQCPALFAVRVKNMFSQVAAIEVIDEDGDGAYVR